VHFVDEPRLQVLANGCRSAEEADVRVAGRGSCAIERCVDPVGHKVKDRAAFHLQRRPRVMCQNERRRVIGRILSPPSAPRFIGPWSTHGPKHVAAEDPRPHARHAFCGQVFVDACLSAFLALHALEGAGVHEPIMQILATNAEWLFSRLTWTGAVAVERDRKA
jgi:hypothetical protein